MIEIIRRKAFVCECGYPAIKRNSCKEPVCARCAGMESIRGHDGTYAKTRVKKDWDLGGVIGHKHWDKMNLFDVEPILYPEAIARLETLLSAIQTSTAVDV